MNKIQKSLFAIALAGLGFAQVASAVTINTSFGILSDADGNPLADGSLLEVIASSNLVIGDLDDVLVATWGLDSATSGLPGADENALFFNLGDSGVNGGTLTAGLNLFLRYYATPAASVQVGLYRTDSPEFGSAWVIPASNSDLILIALSTVSYGGSLPDMEAQTSAIPEPTTGVLVGLSLLGLVGFARRSR